MTEHFEKVANDWIEDSLGSGHPVRKLVEHLRAQLDEVKTKFDAMCLLSDDHAIARVKLSEQLSESRQELSQLQVGKEQWEPQWNSEAEANAAGYNEAREQFQAKIAIATEALENIQDKARWCDCMDAPGIAKEALAKLGAPTKAVPDTSPCLTCGDPGGQHPWSEEGCHYVPDTSPAILPVSTLTTPLSVFGGITALEFCQKVGPDATLGILQKMHGWYPNVQTERDCGCHITNGASTQVTCPHGRSLTGTDSRE